MFSNALLDLQTDDRSNCNFNHESYEIEESVFNCVDSLCEGDLFLLESTVMSTGETPPVVSEEELNRHFFLLSKKQREVLILYILRQ